MMLLGVVLHAALTYNVTKHGDSWGIEQTVDTNLLTDFLVLLIHVFRMPVFFLIAGFFGAMLFYERGVVSMMKNRIARLVWPFLVFLVFLIPIKNICFRYTEAACNGMDNPWAFALVRSGDLAAYIPHETGHLWFLYHLILFTAVGVALALALARFPRLTQKVTDVFRFVFVRPALRVLLFGGLGYCLLSLFQTSMVDAVTGLIPELPGFVWFLYFYTTGWVLYSSKDLLQKLKKFDWVSTLLGVGLVVAQALVILWSERPVDPAAPTPLFLFFGAFTVWLFVFGLTGLFLRYAANYSPVMRYVSDAAYWVYLIHLPLTALLPGLIADWPLPALVKFFLVMLVTAIICFTTYHYLVRNTQIGKFLNGRKYGRGLPKASTN